MAKSCETSCNLIYISARAQESSQDLEKNRDMLYEVGTKFLNQAVVADST
jgi:hypothetical protein